MLAKAPPAIRFEFRRTGVLLRPSLLFKNGVRISCNNDNTSSTVGWRTRTGARVLVVARAGYKRRKMETPGAYELIDDETGEKFIVWGGNDDEDEDEDNSTFSVPSKVILQWKPSDSKIKINKNRSASPATDSNSTGEEEFRKSNSNIRAANKSSAASFGRLKVQRVRNLARATSSIKQTEERDSGFLGKFKKK